MSVLIKDMEMPEKCLYCPMYDEFDYSCRLYSFGIPARYNYENGKRPEWCEMEEVSDESNEDDLLKEFTDAGWKVDCLHDLNDQNTRYFSVTFTKPLPYNKHETHVIELDDLTYEKELPEFDPDKPWNVGDWTIHSYTEHDDGEEDHYALTLTELKMALRLIERVEELKKK